MSDLTRESRGLTPIGRMKSTDGDSNDDVLGWVFDFVIPSSLVLRHFHHQYSRQFA
jgi:hypothetical protein